MSPSIEFTEDPSTVLEVAGAFLASEPVHHNLILSLLRQCEALGDRGQFWMVCDQSGVVGVVFRWPEHFFASITPMSRVAALAAVDAIVDAGIDLPGVNGDAATAAAFAGRWAERTRRPARPALAQRLFELRELTPVRMVSGASRVATAADDGLVIDWFRAFGEEIDEPMRPGEEEFVRSRVERDQVWLWCDPDPVSFVARTEPAALAVRVGPVFTPAQYRGRGYASALVADRSAAILAAGQRALLYAELTNPTSNAIYQAIGYRAIGEVTRYEFDAGD